MKPGDGRPPPLLSSTPTPSPALRRGSRRSPVALPLLWACSLLTSGSAPGALALERWKGGQGQGERRSPLLGKARSLRSNHSADAFLGLSQGPDFLPGTATAEAEPMKQVEVVPTRVASSASSPKKGHDRTFRPGASTGETDIVNFGVFVKGYRGMNLQRSTWTADIVITLQWKDPRVVDLIPQGGTQVTLPIRKARSRLWLPDIIVSNRDVGAVDVLSSAVQVNSSGFVQKVERAVVRMRDKFDFARFPFDRQILRVRLASSALMLDELRLEPITGTNISGIGSGVFDDKDLSLENWETASVDEVISSLRKSRGELQVHVVRDPTPYLQSMFMPELLILVISYSVFWYPLLPPFAMPRVGTAIISFLTMTTLSIKSHSVLPAASSAQWIDSFENCCEACLCYALVLNIFLLSIYHHFKEVELAHKIQYEARFIYAFLLLSVFAFSYPFQNEDLLNLSVLGVALSQGVLVITISINLFRLLRAHAVHEDDPVTKK